MKLCQKRGCPAAATHILKLCAPGPDPEGPGVDALVGLELCAAHLAQVDVPAFIAADPRILGALGLEPGDEALIFAEGVAIESAEGKAFANIAAPRKLN